MHDRDNDGGGESTRSETTGLEYGPISVMPIERVDAGLSGPDSLDTDADAPVALGRYRIGTLIGEGGMGSVFEGYDRQLDRAVAIKIIRRGARPAAQQRLKREAEVMAKLAHPNVLTVLDVGEDGGEVFIVLERIVGRSLAAWLEPSRSSRDILDRFLAAGDGLAAAHREDVVHGDFKPANVLMGRDGRVRVSDFGVGRLRDGDDPTLPDAETATHGRLWGTPRYMAPELFEGRKPNESSDLYAFAAPVYESLYDRPVAEAATVPELAVVKSKPVSIPSSPSVPRWVRNVLARALDPEPSARPRDVRDVLDVLGRRRWSAARTGAVVGAAGVVLGGAAWTQSLDDRLQCDGAQERVATVWNDARRGEVAEAFASFEASYAATVWKRVEPVLDDYAKTWSEAHTETCEATRAGEQSAELLDAKMSCLARQLVALDAFATGLSSGDRKVLDHASRAASDLQPASACLELESVDTSLVPSAALAAHVAAVEDSLTRLRTASSLARYDEAQELCDAAVRDADRIGFEPLIAKVRYWSGRCMIQGGKWAEGREQLQGAAFAAEELGDDALAAEAGLSLMSLLVGSLDDSRGAVAWSPHAEVALKRAHASPREWSRLHDSRALALIDLGRIDEAVEALELANKFANEGQLDAYGRSEIHERTGKLHKLRGEFAEAVPEFRAAHDIHVDLNGPGHPNAIMAQVELADAQGAAGQLEDAVASYDAVEALARESFGTEHPIYWSLQVNHAVALNAVERFDEAAEIQKAAADAFERLVGREHPRYGGSLANLAATLGKAGRHAEAAEQAEIAVPLLKKAFGDDHPIVGFALGTWGAGLINTERWDEAIPPLEEALDLRRRYPESEADTAEVEFALARALFHSGRDEARGLRLAKAALEGVKIDGYDKGIEAVTEWLEAR